MKDLISKMSIKDLRILKSEIEKEIHFREHKTTCIWSVKEEKKKKETPTKEEWKGENYIS